jgi:hypothetical protein
VSRGRDFTRFNAGARQFLSPDIGPVEAEDCSVGACVDAAVYRVPWPSIGDVAYCSHHLARYRYHHPDCFERVQEHVDEDLTALATRGNRWLALEEVPERIRGGRYRRVGVTARGYALFESVEPDTDGCVTYVLVDRDLSHTASIRVPSDRSGEFLETFDQRRGFFEWENDIRNAVSGIGGGADG